MEEILRHLHPGERVLDLGSQNGSFSASACAVGVLIVRTDLDRPASPASDGTAFVQADAAQLPFRTGAFDAVISNHSLEHMVELDAVLGELGRVMNSTAALYVAVPDASTWSDRIYRFIGKGGGHVNAFYSADALSSRITASTGLPLRATRLLHTGWSFLRKRSSRSPRRLWLFGGGYPPLVRAINRFTRELDKNFGFRASIYGWALWFGSPGEGIDTSPRPFVCSNCGAGLRVKSVTCPYCNDPL